MYPFSFDPSSKLPVTGIYNILLFNLFPLATYLVETFCFFRRWKIACTLLCSITVILAYRMCAVYHHVGYKDVSTFGLAYGFLIMMSLRTCFLSWRDMVPSRNDPVQISAVKRRRPFIRNARWNFVDYALSLRKYGWTDDVVPPYCRKVLTYKSLGIRTAVYVGAFCFVNCFKTRLSNWMLLPISANPWYIQVAFCVTSGFFSYLFINALYYLFAIIFVPLGIWDIAEYPLMMGNVSKTTSVNDFWSRDWHVCTKPYFRVIAWDPTIALTGSKFLASCSCFFLSALFHDFAYWSISGRCSPAFFFQLLIQPFLINLEKRIPLLRKYHYWVLIIEMLINGTYGMGVVLLKFKWKTC